MASPDKKKYNKMENVLQYINKNFVTVSDEDTKKTNPILKQVLTTITDAMKSVSPLFNSLFESFLFGGSFYDGLKVGKPDEFDLDLRLVLPKLVDAKLSISNQPGLVTVSMPGWSKFEASSEFAKFNRRKRKYLNTKDHINVIKNVDGCPVKKRKRKYLSKWDRFMLNVSQNGTVSPEHFSRREFKIARDLAKFKDSDNFLVQDKVLQWMEGVVNMALNKIGKVGNRAEIPIDGKKAYVSLKKSGPAVTALISYGNINLDVDLVVVFKMTADQWPASPFKPLPNECNGKKEFLIVPKPPKTDVGKKERYWRLSFQEQERILIMGNNTCKPALRLMKKLRDTQNHNLISSYFIKTVFLHEIDKQDKAFWSSALSFVFMHMLKTYRDCLANYNIPYYWNKKNNLLQYINKTTIDNFKNYLTRVIDAIDKKVDENPYIIGEYLTTAEEQEQLKKVNFVFGKKVTKTEDNSIGDSSLTESTSSVTESVAMLSQRSVDISSTAANESDNKLNTSIIRMLKDMELRITAMHTDTSLVLQKLNSLEQSVDEIKHETSFIKSELRNLGVKDIPETVQTKSDNVELIEQSNNIKFMLQKIDYLDQTVHDLKSENDLLKTGLKQFVMSD